MKNKHRFGFEKGLKLSKKNSEISNATDEDKNDWIALAKYTSVGYYIVTPLIMGVFFGLITDKLIKISPKGVLLGLLIGTIATFYNLFKLTKEK